jgi:hypothetical protein
MVIVPIELSINCLVGDQPKDVAKKTNLQFLLP